MALVASTPDDNYLSYNDIKEGADSSDEESIAPLRAENYLKEKETPIKEQILDRKSENSLVNGYVSENERAKNKVKVSNDGENLINKTSNELVKNKEMHATIKRIKLFQSHSDMSFTPRAAPEIGAASEQLSALNLITKTCESKLDNAKTKADTSASKDNSTLTSNAPTSTTPENSKTNPNQTTEAQSMPQTRFGIEQLLNLNRSDDNPYNTKRPQFRRREKTSISRNNQALPEINQIRAETAAKKTTSPPPSSELKLRRCINELPLRPVTTNTKAGAPQPSTISKGPITVDTSKASSNLEVVRLCINELGWQEYPNGSATGCDIYWHSSTYHEGYHSTKLAYNHNGKVNKFPCMNQLLRKGPLTLSLNVMRSIYKEAYDFYPRTWFLPEQFNDFKTDCHFMHEIQSKKGQRHSTFIVKPNDGSQGDGIILIKDPDAYLRLQASMRNRSRSYIVQEYIDEPFLIDGLKSDLRIYVVIVRLKPLEIHMCDEGLVRFATLTYQPPNEANLNQVFMHLTNYSLNKKNESYQFTKENTPSEAQFDKMDSEGLAGKGSKRKLSKVFAYMDAKGYNVRRIRHEIDDLVIKTIFALLPEMKVEYEYEIPPNLENSPGPSCFQILGFDILLTRNLKPILLEVNCNPSLRIDFESENEHGITLMPSPIDQDIKKPLILETLKLIAPKKKMILL